MTDGPSAIDPLVAEGPLAPVESLRPAPSLQRVLILDSPTPQMVDLAAGNVRPYENGPPVSVPMTSTRFDFAALTRLQVQVLRDPRPTSLDTTLLSLQLADAGVVVDVRETPDGTLRIDAPSGSASGPIGASPAVVVVVTRIATEQTHRLSVTARNAETMTHVEHELAVATTTNAMVTIGGPTSDITGQHGRRRTIPVHLETSVPVEPVDQMRRAVRGAKRVAGSIRARGK